MGVKYLWKILPSKKRSPHSQKLAIDTSIWLHYYKNADENHFKYLTIMRILKLLHKKNLPVFVFDGKTPDLKKFTMEKRKKERNEREIVSAAQRVLKNEICKSCGIPINQCQHSDLINKKEIDSWDEKAIETIKTDRPKRWGKSRKNDQFWLNEKSFESLSNMSKVDYLLNLKLHLYCEDHVTDFYDKNNPENFGTVQIENMKKRKNITDLISNVYGKEGKRVMSDCDKRLVFTNNENSVDYKSEMVEDNRKKKRRNSIVQKTFESEIDKLFDDEESSNQKNEDGNDKKVKIKFSIDKHKTNNEIIDNYYEEDSLTLNSSYEEENSEELRAKLTNIKHQNEDGNFGSDSDDSNIDDIKNVLYDRKIADSNIMSENENKTLIKRGDEKNGIAGPEKLGESKFKTESKVKCKSENKTLESDSMHNNNESKKLPKISLSQEPIDMTNKHENPAKKQDENKKYHTTKNQIIEETEERTVVQKKKEEVNKISSEIQEAEQSILREKEREYFMLNQNFTTELELLTKKIKEILIAFDLPYIDAPFEADSQCAFLSMHDIVDAVVTEDNDVFLYGAKKVYRNYFRKNKFIEEYNLCDIETVCTRDEMIKISYLVGSDYSMGVEGFGIKKSIEYVKKNNVLDDEILELKNLYYNPVVNKNDKIIWKKLNKKKILEYVNKNIQSPVNRKEIMFFVEKII